jgi:hypothetical protein
MAKTLKCCPFCGGRLAVSEVEEFIKDVCVRDKRSFTPAAELYAAYRRWCRKRKPYQVMRDPITVTAFGRGLNEAGFINHRGHVVHWFGLRVCTVAGKVGKADKSAARRRQRKAA